MKSKIMAVLAIIAMMFAATAVLAEDSEAASSGAITLSSSTVNEERTILVTYSLSLSDVDAGKPLKGFTVTWTVEGADAVITGTNVGGLTSDTDVSGKAYATLKAKSVNADATVTVKATASNSALSINVAEASSTPITIKDVTTPKIGTWTVTEAEDFDAANNPLSRMYLFQYTDHTLVIDTRYMTNLNGVSNVHVGLSWSSSAPDVDTGYQLVNALGINQKLFIDLKNPKLGTLDGETLWVKLFNYDGTVDEDKLKLTPLSKSISLTVEMDTPLSKLQLVPQYANLNEGVHGTYDVDGNLSSYTCATEYANLVRNETFLLDETASVELLRAGYSLEAWSHNKVKVNGYLDGDGSEDVPLKALPIEEILMLATQASPVTAVDTGKTGDAPAYVEHKTIPITKLYGVWEKKFYTIAYVDSTEPTEPISGDVKAVEADDGKAATSPFADISGSTVIGGEETSFGIISIVKRGNAADPQSTYMIQVMNENGDVLVKYRQAPIQDAAVQIDMVNNGTWKIHHVTQNLKICAVAITTTALETGANFSVNYIKNDSTNKNGEARLTLDLNDYPNIANQEIYMKGTYYRVLTDLAGVRVYGNIENLTTLGDGVLTIGEAANAERIYTGYIDKVSETAAYLKADGETAAEASDKPGAEGSTIQRAGHLDNGKLYTTIGPKGYEYQGGHSYDLVLKTKTGAVQGLYLYGIQGVWDTDGQVWNDDGTALADKTTTSVTYFTPWAIYEDNSDGQ